MKKIIYSVLILIVGLVVVAVVWYLATKQPSASSTGGQSTTTTQGNGNPFGNPSGGTVASSTSGADTITLMLRDGSEAEVPDFTKGPQPTTANAVDGYQVVGSATSTFDILYFPDNSGILVTLLSEPLGSVRLDAENALRQKTGLSNAQMCALTADVGTTIQVNSYYSGKNLGFSFCPGATVLPQ